MKQFQNEKLYQTTMFMARKLLSEGVISEEEYRQIDTIFTKKISANFGYIIFGLSLDFCPEKRDI